MDWDYLDEMDKNLLYIYAKALTGKNSRTSFSQLHTALNSEKNASEEVKEFEAAEASKKQAFYIIWFVYRYVLGCDTLEKALMYTSEDFLKEYKLYSFLKKRKIYIGIYGMNEVYLYNCKNGDLEIILDILYNRYNFFEQLECFIRHTEGTAKTTRARCIKALKEYNQLVEGMQTGIQEKIKSVKRGGIREIE